MMKYDKPIVKFQGQYWVVDETKGDMLILMRDGKRAIVPKSAVTYYTGGQKQ